MKPITWEEFKKILNKIDKEHKVTLTPTTQEGRYSTDEKGKAIRFVVPVISMNENNISIIEIFTNNGESYKFTTNSKSKFDSLYEVIINWLK